MIKECKKALLKSWAGVVILLSALLLVALGQDDFYGYFEEHYMLLGVLSFSMLILGALLLPAYLRCVRTGVGQNR